MLYSIDMTSCLFYSAIGAGRMYIFLVVFLLLICRITAKNMFIICDTNSDKKISYKELEVCMNVVPELKLTMPTDSLSTKVNQLMKLFDADKDGSVSIGEFHKLTEKATESFELDEYIEVTKKDGTKQKVHRSELFNTVKDSAKGFEMKNDKIFKQDSESGEIKELTKKDHALGNMIRIGQWAASQLVLWNHTTGALMNLESLPRGGSLVSKERMEKEPEMLGVQFSGKFEVRSS